jgi:cytoskeletal protein CcmA (bactofilin family)
MPPAGPDPATVAASRGDATVIAEHDHLEGTLRSAQGVLVLGSFSGSIESESWVRMAERSTVKADVTAQEVVVAGSYEGRLLASGRLEIAATGQVRGEITAPRLLLHEGGFIDGALSMTRPEPGRPGAASTDRAQEAPSRPGSVRESSGGGSPRKGAAAIPVEPQPTASPAPETPAAR